ncbi:MAG: TIGR02757 family protein [Bacteroidaceae bacterium]|nr:TIGR02757 family protein [Bacteroidaceae bacterium]
MNQDIKNRIKELSSRYETAGFIVGDPSWFMHQVEGNENQETTAFLASCFSYGSRKQFMQKVLRFIEYSDGDVYSWVRSRAFEADIPQNDTCFYRLYTNEMVIDLLQRLSVVINMYGSIRDFIVSQLPDNDCKSSAYTVLDILTSEFGGSIVPRNTKSSCKRLCMFLRWMVRDNSPVDLGLWKDVIDKRTLIMPMDTHVIQQAARLGLLRCTTASMTNARKLTEVVSEIFPDDPLKADFALFGVGVNHDLD